jgi:hypothetical protein
VTGRLDQASITRPKADALLPTDAPGYDWQSSGSIVPTEAPFTQMVLTMLSDSCPMKATCSKIVSERLGYKGIAITLELYSHVLPAMDQEAANRVAGMFDG